MLPWAILFFIFAVIAALFAYGPFAMAATGIAKALVLLFVCLFFIFLAYSFLGKGPRSPR